MSAADIFESQQWAVGKNFLFPYIEGPLPNKITGPGWEGPVVPVRSGPGWAGGAR